MHHGLLLNDREKKKTHCDQHSNHSNSEQNAKHKCAVLPKAAARLREEDRRDGEPSDVRELNMIMRVHKLGALNYDLERREN